MRDERSDYVQEETVLARPSAPSLDTRSSKFRRIDTLRSTICSWVRPTGGRISVRYSIEPKGSLVAKSSILFMIQYPEQQNL